MTKTTLGIALSDGPVIIGSNFTINGYLQESGSGNRINDVRVTLERRTKNTSWQELDSVQTNSSGEYSFSTREQHPGVCDYQTRFEKIRNQPAGNPPDFYESTVSDTIKIRARTLRRMWACQLGSVLGVVATMVIILLAQNALRAFVPDNIALMLSLLVPVVVIAIVLFYNAWLIAGHSKRHVLCGLGFIDLAAGALILFALAYGGRGIYQFFASLVLIAATAILWFGLAHVCSRHSSGPRNVFDALGFVTVFAGAVILALTGISVDRLASWFFLMLALTLLIFYLGPIVFSTRGNWRLRGLDWYGVLVDGRNRVSLVRFQVVIWTILTLATFGEAALANVASGAQNPVFVVVIPNNLWLLLGISITALPVTLLATIPNVNKQAESVKDAIALRKTKEQSADLPPEADSSQQILNKAVLDAKATNQGDTSVRLFTVTQPNGDIEKVILQGVAAARPRVEDARLKDIFTGDEIANYGYLDPSKVQLFVFNIVLILVYAVALGSFLYQFPPPYTTLPNVPDVLAVFLGVSNGAYLTYKALPLF